MKKIWSVSCFVIFVIIDLCGSASASPQWPISKCDLEWHFCKTYIKPYSDEHTKRQKEQAEQGNVDSQYFLGVVLPDKKEKKRWLEMAIANGSKEAAAYNAYYLDERWDERPLSPDVHAELLKALIVAAEAGDPRAATWLMEMARGQNKHCPRKTEDCPDSPLIKPEDTRKWAEIAALGGNMGAAEYLCEKLYWTDDPRGFLKNDEKAYFWCSIAAPQVCAVHAKRALAALYSEGRVPLYAQPRYGEYWNQRSKQDSRQLIQGSFIYSIGSSCF